MVVVTVAGVILVAAAGLLWYGSVERDEGPGQSDEAVAVAAFASPGAAKGRNLLLVTLDTTRADHLGCYGDAQARTPTLDRLAAEGVRFEQVVTAAPITLPAHCTILTGLYPPAHGVRDDGAYRLLSEQVTLAETLRENGYTTAAFVSAFALDRRSGLGQGFDHYNDALALRFRAPTAQMNEPDRPANLTIDAALAWLKSHRQAGAARPFFVWVHLYDPHLPYLPPPDLAQQFGNRTYDAEIAFADRELGRLIAGLSETAFAANTVTAVVGSNGEGLGEHGEWTHGHLLYESTTRVPLILHGPPIVKGATVVSDVLAGTVDVMPTLLDLLGLAAPPVCEGRSLLRASDPRRTLYMETLVPMLNDGWAPLFAARRLRDKYIEAPTPEYYDLSADPKELNNLQPNEPSAATELAAALGKMRAAFPEPSAKAARSLTREELASLAGLGYVSPAASQPSQPADPKSMVASLHERLVATDLLQRGRTAEAAAKLEALTKASPGSADLWLLLAQANERIGGLSAALPAARNAVSADPADPELWCALAAYQFAVGDVAKGETALARAERIDPNCGRVWMLRSWRAVQQRDLSEAMKLARRAAEVDAPRMGGEAFALIGRMHEHDGRMEEAQKAYEASLNFDPLNGASLLARAKIALRDDDANLAVMLLQGLVEWQPEFVEGGLILGRLFYQNKQPDIAERVYVKVLSVAPGNGLAHYEMARVLASQGKADEAIGHLEAAARTGQIDFASLRNDPGFAPIKDDPRVAELEATAASQQPAPSPAGPPSP